MDGKTDTTQKGEFKDNRWAFEISESHILRSEGPDREQFESALHPLPQVPEMTFDRNVLTIRHDEGFGLQFNALDALRSVDAENDLMKVAVSEAWKSSRSDVEQIHEVFKPFDWTFTTHYKGTLVNDGEKVLTAQPTKEQIDYEKLKVEEKILFYASLLLYEDELSDNGASILSLKCRAMPSGFFILLRFYLRVDNVLLRVHDTRIHCEYEKNYILREYSVRECSYNQIKVPPHIITDTNEVVQHLPVTQKFTEKLVFPPLDK